MVEGATLGNMIVTILSSRRDNGCLAFKAKELEFECYAPPGFDPSFVVNSGDKLELKFHRPTDMLTGKELPYFVADDLTHANSSRFHSAPPSQII